MGGLPVAATTTRTPVRPLPLLDAQARGKTVGLNLTEDELVLYREWIENNRKLERLVKDMRHLSSRALALITGRQAP